MEKNRTFFFVSGRPIVQVLKQQFSKTSILKHQPSKTSTVKNINRQKR
jgi:hypothetical protein